MPPRSLRVAENIHTREFDGELVLLDLNQGHYYALDAIGMRVWRSLADGQSIDQVAYDIANDFGEPTERVVSDINALVADLFQKGMVIDADSFGASST